MATRRKEAKPKQAVQEPEPEQQGPHVTRVSHAPVIHPAAGHEDNRTMAPHIERSRQAEIRRSLHAHRAPPHGRGRGR